MSSDLAIAALSARQALRSRLVPAVAVTIAGATVALAVATVGDGTPAGRLRAYLSWSLGFEVFLLSLTTVFLGAAVADGIRSGRWVPLTASALPRWRLLFGWWLGQAAVLALLVGVGHVGIGIGAGLMAAAAEPREREDMRGVFRSQVELTPEPLDAGDIEVAALGRFEQLQRTGALPSDLSADEVLEELRRQEEVRRRTVLPRRRIEWTLPPCEPAPGSDVVVLRFRYVTQAARGVLSEGRGPRGCFHLRTGVEANGLDIWLESAPGTWPGGASQELRVPAALFRETAQRAPLKVQYESLDERAVVVVFPENAIQVLYSAGGWLDGQVTGWAFVTNLFRSGLLVLARLLLLAALAVAASSLIEGRLAALVVLFVVVVGSGHDFLVEALGPSLFGVLDGPLKALLHGVLLALPDLASPDVSDRLANSLAVQGSEVVRSWGGDVLLRGGLVLGLGSWAFTRRELGAVR